MGRPRTWTDEQFVTALTTATCWSEVSRQLQVKPCGQVILRFRETADRLDIDIEHLRFQRPTQPRWCQYCGEPLDGRLRQLFCSGRCDQAYRTKQRLNDWLTTGVLKDTGGRFARDFILREQGNCCAVCLRDATWQDKPLVFILDHINGNSSDNSRPNLRLVCPNCDSQLDTYKSRNRGNGRHVRRQRYAAGKSY